jgi:hypothetical protein
MWRAHMGVLGVGVAEEEGGVESVVAAVEGGVPVTSSLIPTPLPCLEDDTWCPVHLVVL